MAGIKIPRRARVGSVEQRLTVVNPGRGLNSLISDSLIKDQEASDLSNVQFVESGCPAKRPGIAAVGTGLSNNPRGLATFITESYRQVLTLDGTALKYLNGTAWTSIAGATFDSSSTTISFTQASNKMFIWDGVNGGAYWDGSTLSRPGTMPKAKFSIYYQGIHIASGVAGQPNRLYFSVVTDPTQFTRASGQLNDSTAVPGATAFTGPTSGTGSALAQFVDVSVNDGDMITGLAKFKDLLVVFKERSIFQVTLDSTGVPVLAPINRSIGAVSHKSIENVENDVFFLSRNGYYVLGNEPNFFDVIRTNELSARIHPTLDSITASNYTRAASLYSNYRFYSAIPYGGTTTNNRVLMYDRRFLAWSIWTGINANAWTMYTDSSNVDHIYYAADDEAKVYELLSSTYNDNGSAISAYWQSKAFDLGDFSRYKRWLYVDLFFRQISGSVTISLITDGNVTTKTSQINAASSNYSMGVELLGSQLLGGTPDPNATSSVTTATSNVPYRVKLNTVSRTLKVKVTNNNNNENFTLLGIIIGYRPFNSAKFPSTLKLF